MIIEVAYITHAGVVKKINQDAILLNSTVATNNSKVYGLEIADEKAILAISDGVSSSPRPDVASRLTLEYLSAAFFESNVFLPIKTIRDIQDKLSIYAKQDKSFKNSSCTLAGIVFEGRKIKIFNVGDTRVYKIQNNKLEQLSHDHTVLNTYIQEGIIKQKDKNAYASNYKMLDSCIIANFDADDFEIYTSEWLEAKNGDAYMICSDGLSDLLGDDQMSNIINLSNIEATINNLFESAMQIGGYDNISIVICKVKQS